MEPERNQVLESVTSCTAQFYNMRQLNAGTYVHKNRDGNFINTANGYYGVQTFANYCKGHEVSDLANDINSFALSFFLVFQECSQTLPALVFLYNFAEKALGTKEAGLLAVENTYVACDEVVEAIQKLRQNIYSLKDALGKQTNTEVDYKVVEYLHQSHTQKIVPEQVGITQYALDYTVSFYYNFCRCLSGQWNWHDKIGDYHKGSIHLGMLPHHSIFYDFFKAMKDERIDYIFCITRRFENTSGTFQAAIKPSEYLENEIEFDQSLNDDFVTLPIDDLERNAERMDRKLKAGKNIYVHCKAGRGRSAQQVIAYLVICHNMTVQKALEHVKSKRVQVSLGKARLDVLEKIAAKHQKPYSISNEFEIL